MTNKRKRDIRDYILLLIIFSTLSMLIPGVTFGADGDAQSWYTSMNWTSIVVTLLGGTGIFGGFKYFWDYKLGNRKMDVDESAMIRDEMKELMDRMQAEINGLRRRVHLLETCLSKNDIPLPYSSENANIKLD